MIDHCSDNRLTPGQWRTIVCGRFHTRGVIVSRDHDRVCVHEAGNPAGGGRWVPVAWLRPLHRADIPGTCPGPTAAFGGVS